MTRSLSFWLVVAGLIWWVIPVLLFLVTALVVNKSHLAGAVLTLLGVAWGASLAGAWWACRRRLDALETAATWAIVAALLCAAPIAIFIVG